jgi:kinesin light chain
MTTDRKFLSILIKFRRKIEEIGKMAGLTQDEILQSTRTVCQGLEALKEEHESIKSTLLSSLESLQNDEKKVVEEKSKLLSKNLDSIQLGIEEAHVSMV